MKKLLTILIALLINGYAIDCYGQGQITRPIPGPVPVPVPRDDDDIIRKQREDEEMRKREDEERRKQEAEAQRLREEAEAKAKYNGHEYVDLGLPSGIKWATCNVGAKQPSDYGSYFAWGETSPKSRYDWSNCFDCLDGDYNSWGVYKIGGKTQITPTSGHDAARENWGGTWRMPTDAENEELVNKCKWTWTTKNGHNGYLVTGPNGNSIFLPAAGWRSGTVSDDVGAYGDYWSSSLSSSYSYSARYLYFNSGCRSTYDSNRRYGFSVRPVTE